MQVKLVMTAIMRVATDVLTCVCLSADMSAKVQFVKQTVAMVYWLDWKIAMMAIR